MDWPAFLSGERLHCVSLNKCNAKAGERMKINLLISPRTCSFVSSADTVSTGRGPSVFVCLWSDRPPPPSLTICPIALVNKGQMFLHKHIQPLSAAHTTTKHRCCDVRSMTCFLDTAPTLIVLVRWFLAGSLDRFPPHLHCTALTPQNG